MATDKSPVRYAIIVQVTVFSIVTLVVLRVALGSYFDHFVQAEEHRKVGEIKPESLMSLRADEAQRLAAGSMPIETAMQTLAKRGRLAMSPEIAPTASRDVGPLQGWVKMPAEVPAPMAAEADASAASTAPEVSDAAADAAPSKTPAAGLPKADGGPTHKKLP
jgi:hypothetical protein